MGIKRRLIFFNDTATTEIYALSLHDALPIWHLRLVAARDDVGVLGPAREEPLDALPLARGVERAEDRRLVRSEEHTSELQSRQYLVCRLLLAKKQSNQFQLRHPLLNSSHGSI